MSDLRYTNDHEWARVEGLLVTVGITDYAVSYTHLTLPTNREV